MSSPGDELLQCLGTCISDAAHEFFRHGALFVTKMDRVYALVREDNDIEAFIELSRMQVAIEDARVGEAELLQKPTCPPFVHAWYVGFVQPDSGTPHEVCVWFRFEIKVAGRPISPHLLASFAGAIH